MFHKGKWKAAQQGGTREASHYSAALCSPPAAQKDSECSASTVSNCHHRILGTQTVGGRGGELGNTAPQPVSLMP